MVARPELTRAVAGLVLAVLLLRGCSIGRSVFMTGGGDKLGGGQKVLIDDGRTISGEPTDDGGPDSACEVALDWEPRFWRLLLGLDS